MNAQIPEKISRKMGPYPILFLDSIEISIDTLKAIDPFKISNIGILIPKKARKILGEKGSDGAVYVTSIKAAKKYYWNFLCTKSEKYKLIFQTPESDSVAEYILNGNELSHLAVPGNLFRINNKNFKKIDIDDINHSSGDSSFLKSYVIKIKSRKIKN